MRVTRATSRIRVGSCRRELAVTETDEERGRGTRAREDEGKVKTANRIIYISNATLLIVNSVSLSVYELLKPSSFLCLIVLHYTAGYFATHHKNANANTPNPLRMRILFTVTLMKMASAPSST